jgi:lysophospholipase L1-like esterase
MPRAMSRALLPLALLAALALALTAGQAARARAVVAPAALAAGEIYLALGDSLSTGDEAAANNDDLPGYPAYLRDLIQATTPISFTLLGVSGETTSSMLADGGQLDQAEAFIAEQRAAGQNIGLITLSIGGNDVINVLRGGDKTVTETLGIVQQNLGLILDRLIAASTADGAPRPTILLMNYYNPYPGMTIPNFPPLINLPPGQEPIVTDRDLPKFNRVLARVAAERCIPVVDAFSVVRGHEAEYLFVTYPIVLLPIPDEADLDYHPREAGHQALAEAFLAALDDLGCQAYLPLALN